MLKKFNCKKVVTVFVLVILSFNMMNVLVWKWNATVNQRAVSYKPTINWAQEYPFAEVSKAAPAPAVPAQKNSFLHSFVQKLRNRSSSIQKEENVLETNCIYQLFAFRPLVELNGFVNLKCGKMIYPNQEVFQLNNGYWAFTKDPLSASSTKRTADNIAGLSQFCSGKNIPFLYVQCPDKTCKYDPEMPNGAEDCTNENYDALLAELQKLSIPSFDLRDQIHAESLNHYGMFYRTDHHWKVETGLWAAGEITRKLNDSYGCKLDAAKTNAADYQKQVYKDWFLGSAGRRVSLGCAQPEDFTLMLPKFSTQLQLEVPNMNICKTGKFEDVIYNQETLKSKDYYNLSCYESQLYGNQPLTKVTNKKNPNGQKILVLGDSFSLALVPYLSLTSRETDLIDFRRDQGNFTGSIRNFINTEKPDIVLLTYEPGSDYSFQ